MSAVVDTSALIALGHLHLLRLLPLLFGEVYVPQGVVDEWAEGSAGSPEEAAALEGLSPGWLQIRSLDVALEETEASLGRGEEEVIALARDIGAEYVVLDDLAARDLAASQGLRVIGTVGILIAARRKGVIPSAISLLENLREEGFRLSDDIVDAVRRDEEGTTS